MEQWFENDTWQYEYVYRYELFENWEIKVSKMMRGSSPYFFILLLIILSSYHQFFCRVPGIDFQKLRFFYFVINLWHVLLFCRNSYANQIFCCHFFAFQSKYNYAYHAIKFFLRNKSNKGKYAQQTSPLLKLLDAYRLYNRKQRTSIKFISYSLLN